MSPIAFVTGGARSGKSRYALELGRRISGRRAFIATAEPHDDEMRERIQKHRDERGNDFDTIEEPFDLAGALRQCEQGFDVTVVDCLTVWLSNVIFRCGEGPPEDKLPLAQLLAYLDRVKGEIVLVSNEVGMGIVPDNALARSFRDAAGFLNQEVAARSQKVVFMVSGLPLIVRDEGL